jgi:hypothetical protein
MSIGVPLDLCDERRNNLAFDRERNRTLFERMNAKLNALIVREVGEDIGGCCGAVRMAAGSRRVPSTTSSRDDGPKWLTTAFAIRIIARLSGAVPSGGARLGHDVQ